MSLGSFSCTLHPARLATACNTTGLSQSGGYGPFAVAASRLRRVRGVVAFATKRQLCALWPQARLSNDRPRPRRLRPRATSKGATTYGRQDYGGGADYTLTPSPRVPGYLLRVAVRRTRRPRLRLRPIRRSDYGGQRPVATAVTGQGGYEIPPERRLRCSSTTAADALTSSAGSQHHRSDQDAQFRLPDAGVRRRGDPGGLGGSRARRLNSTNSTTVNNAPVQEWQLADGDVIRLGHSEIIDRMHWAYWAPKLPGLTRADHRQSIVTLLACSAARGQSRRDGKRTPDAEGLVQRRVPVLDVVVGIHLVRATDLEDRLCMTSAVMSRRGLARRFALGARQRRRCTLPGGVRCVELARVSR